MKNRVYLTTKTVGQSFGTSAQVRRHHPGCDDHGALLAETKVLPLGFYAAALNLTMDMSIVNGWTVVDEDYQP